MGFIINCDLLFNLVGIYLHLVTANKTLTKFKSNAWKLSCGFWCLDDNPINGLTSVLSVEHVLNAKLTGFNTSEQVWWSKD
jgi:hypothetical protein